MTQEDKKLLVKDLCARLPYGLKVKTPDDDEAYTLLSVNANKGIAVVGMLFDDVFATSKIKIEDAKPCLRKMSSMTEKEKEEYTILANRTMASSVGFVHLEINELIDWLNTKHFDYRGFIDKVLAIEVTKENNPYKP